MRRSQHAFSMLELAVVLAILGLIAGGVMGGQSLIKASRLRASLAQANGYALAIRQFEEQYGEWPGDFSRANELWADAASGDGNGSLESPVAAGGIGENFQLWRHLQRAGYIVGNYTGAAGSGSEHHAIPGTNTPAGPLPGSAFWHHNWGNQTGANTDFFNGDYTNVMVFGGANASGWPSGSVMTGGNAYEIDSKADDGYPGMGSIRTFSAVWLQAAGYGCVPAAMGNDARLATYARTSSTCLLFFMRDFGKRKRM